MNVRIAFEIGGATMTMRAMYILVICLLFFVSATVTTSDAATIFTGSRITAIDEGQRTITFKTRDGQTWTLPVTDPKLLNRPAKDEAVTIEVNLNDQIINIVKASDVPAAPPTETEDR
jgi:uncharacterized protein YjdB